MKYTSGSGITPHNSTVITIDTTHGTSNDAVYIGVGGDVSMTLVKDTSTVVFKNMISGTIYALAAKIIAATDTDATDIVVLDSGSRHV